MYINKQSNIQKKDLVSTKTASGNPVVITDCAGGKARSLKTTIGAIQDLHGYDHPWAGGADVNKANVADAEIGIAWNGNENPDRARLVIPCSASTTYTISIQGTSNLDSIYVNDTETVPASSSGSTIGTQHTFTTGVSSAYIVVGFNKTNIAQADINALKLQLELGSAKTSYRPYSNICPISGRTEARVDTENEDSSESAYAVIQLGTTVYGADINWDTGVMTVKDVRPEYDGSEAWSISNHRFAVALSPDSVNTPSEITCKCNMFAPKTASDLWANRSTADYVGVATQGATAYVVDNVHYTNYDDTDLTAFKAALASNNLQICYELATPTTLQLTTPTQLELLKGYNRVSIDNGSITLDYIPDNLAGDILSLVEEDYVKLEAVNTDPISVSGNPIVIQDAAAIKARSLKTTIEPIQDLHGYDHPWAGGAGKNLLPLTTDNIKSANGGTSSWTGNKKTISGSEVEILEDADGNTLGVKISNTPNATLIVNLYTFANGALSGNYALNGCPANGGDSTYNITLFDGTTALRDKGSGVSFASSDFSSTIQCFIRIQSGYAIPSGGLIFKPMIRLATESDASFAPWENKCPISGRTEARVDTENEDSSESAYAVIQLGQTVYGADINWDTGVVTVLWASKAFSDIDNWNFNASYHIAYCYVTGKANGYDTIMSDSYKVVNKPYAEMADGEISAVQGQDGMNVKDDRFDNLTDFMTAMGSSQLVYELATPTTLQLTPAQLELLKGYNRVTLADGYGTIELSYQKDNIAGDIASLTENELSIKADNSDISSNFELGSTASKAYSTNQFMLREDGLYKVTSNIASGAEITSSNTAKVTITEVLTALLNA